MEERFVIKTITEEMWPEVKELINNGWKSGHIFTKSDALLKWHYTGFGKYSKEGAFALYDNDKIIGFRLMIPIEISLSSTKSKRVIQSAVSTLYYILPEYRGMKLGLKMQLYVMEKWGSFFAIASNLGTSAPIYRKSGAFMLDKMYRHIIPLREEYGNIMLEKSDRFKGFIYKGNKATTPVNLNPKELSDFWHQSTNGVNVTSLERDEEFWDWRYKQSPVYKYVFFGGEKEGGIIVGRVCNLYDGGGKQRSEKVFRILEFIPANKNVWSGSYDKDMHNLLEEVIGWAKNEGCVACEFYTSTTHFDSILSQTGFLEININPDHVWLDSFSYFEPCGSGRLCNVSLYVKEYDDEFDFNNTYFTLSDADQDRPNVL